MFKRKLRSHRAAEATAFLFMFALFLVFSAPIKAQTPTPNPTPEPGPIPLSKYINTYVSVMDPNVVEDVFGKRISDRFVAIQVTISNKNPNFQFLIHDVSLDLKNVFGRKVARNVDTDAEGRCTACISSCLTRVGAEDTAARNQCRAGCGSVCRSGRIRFELSSLELSLIRGVAEKGQAQDRRNKLLRIFEGVGTVAAGLIGIAGFGPSYGDAVALYNGEVLAAYRHVFPDFTINQMNRLSDSAYKSNTIIPKEQARVLVAFIPQSIFLNAEQRKKFRKDPTSLYPDYNLDNPNTDYTVDFRRASALVDGSFIVELENLPAVVTGFHIDSDEAIGFLKSRPVVKGYILGQFLEGAQIELVNPPEGMTIAVDKDATPEEGKLFFVLNSTQPVHSGTPLTIKLFNKQSSQTVSQPILYVTPVPTLDAPDTALEGTVGGADVPISLTGTNLIPGVTVFGFDPKAGSGIEVTDIHLDTADGKSIVTATLKMAKAKPGHFKFRARNGTEVATVDFTVKPKANP